MNWKRKVDQCKFRDGAGFTCDFGLDNTFDKLRIHCGVDRAGGLIYVPFDCKVEYINPYNDACGSLLRMFPCGGDFEIRIMHIDLKDLCVDAYKRVKAGGFFKAGEAIAEAGNLGKSTGKHTHTEIISTGEYSQVVETLLDDLKANNKKRWHYDDYSNMIYDLGLEQKQGLEDYFREIKNRNISFINSVKIKRIDYLDNREKTFYNSRIVMNM